TQRHIARSIASSKRQSLLGLAALGAGLLAASRAHSGDAANAVVAGTQAAAIQGQLNFSRDMEREADRVGLGVMSGAGFAPAGMASMFEKLEQANRLNDSGAYPYLRSHPLTTERIGEARSRAGDARRAPATGGAAPSPPVLHALMRERAQVLIDTGAGTLRRLQEGGASEVASPSAGNVAPAAGAATVALATAYRQALASAWLRDAPATRTALAALRRRADAMSLDLTTQRALQALAVEAPLVLGDTPAAEAALPPLVADGGRVATLLQAQVAVAQARLPNGAASPDAAAAAVRRSTEALQVWTADHPQDAVAWTQLGETADAAGQPLRAQRARAEARAASGDLAGAVDLLRATQRGARVGGAEMIELQVIDARLRALDRELRERRAEAKNGR
ncbi:MAG: M48 family metalloprotease, partial [Rubrivivax sp.]